MPSRKRFSASNCCLILSCSLGFFFIHSGHSKLTESAAASCGKNSFYHDNSDFGDSQRRTNSYGRCVSSAEGCKLVGGHVLIPDENNDNDGQSVEQERSRASKSRAPESTQQTFQYGCAKDQVCCVEEERAKRDPECDTCGKSGPAYDYENGIIYDSPPLAPSSRLVVTVRNEFCWHVVIIDSNSGIVGSGALISRNHVLTAASLVANRNRDNLVVLLGNYDFVQHNESQYHHEGLPRFRSSLNQVILHPDYNPETGAYNLALIYISDAPCSDASVCTICRPACPVHRTSPVPNPGFQSTKTAPTYESYGQYSFNGHESSTVDEWQLLNDATAYGALLDKQCYVSGFTDYKTKLALSQLSKRRVHIVRNEFCGFASNSSNDTAQVEICVLALGFDPKRIPVELGSPLACYAADKTYRVQGIFAGPGKTSGSLKFVDTGTLIEFVENAVDVKNKYDLPLPPLAANSKHYAEQRKHGQSSVEKSTERYISNAVLGAKQCGITKDGKADPFNLSNQPLVPSPLSLAQYVKIPPTADVKRLQQTSRSVVVRRPKLRAPIEIVPARGSWYEALERGTLADFQKSATKTLNNTTTTTLRRKNANSLRIRRGQLAAQNQLCWTVRLSIAIQRLGTGKTSFVSCTGSIIGDKYILTAAHCMQGFPSGMEVSYIDVFVGFTNFDNVEAQLREGCAEVIRSRRFFVIPGAVNLADADGSVLKAEHDNAFIELERPVNFSKPCVCAICVDAYRRPRLYEQCVEAGFGARDNCNTPSPPPLTYIKETFDYTGAQCFAINAPILDDSFYCTTPSVVGTSPCVGDSGSGLICYDQDRKRHVISATATGVVPTANACCGGEPDNATFTYQYRGNDYEVTNVYGVYSTVYGKVDALLARRCQLYFPEIALEWRD